MPGLRVDALPVARLAAKPSALPKAAQHIRKRIFLHVQWQNALVRSKPDEQQAQSQCRQPDYAQAAFRQGQKTQQRAAHAARKQRPAQPLKHYGKAQGAKKEFNIKFHAFLVTKKACFVKE